MSKEMSNATESLTSLEDFQGWDDISEDGDFFSEIEKETKKKSTETEEVIEEVIKDEETEEKTEKPEEKKESPEEDLFSNEENEEFISNENIEIDEEEESQGSVNPSMATVNFLKEKGFIDYELEEGQELTEEMAEELIEDKFDDAIDKRMEELFKDVPDVVKQINKYAINGGDVSQFFDTLTKAGASEITENLDLTDKSNQELVVREMLRAEDNDEEYISTQLEFLEDSGKLEMFAEKKFNKWKDARVKEQDRLVKQQEQEVRAQREALRRSKQEMSSFMEKNESVGELKFTKDDKKALPSYMNDKNVKLQNGATISQLQKELFYDLPQNREAFLQLATLMKNRNKDGTFNFESIIKNTETKVVKKVKENVRRSKQSVPTKSKAKRQNSKRSLADFFNQSNH